MRPPAGRPAPTGLRDSPVAVGAHLVEKLAPQLRLLVVKAAPKGRHRARALFLDTAHLRAEMRRLDVHRHAARLDEIDQRIRDLLSETLLHGEATSIEPHESRQLRDPEDLVPSDVRDMHGAVERQRVTLADREERDRPLDNLTLRAADALRPRRTEHG